MQPAPHSLRNDYHLRHDDEDPRDVIVRHMWGNIAGEPIDVTKMLHRRYNDWNVKSDNTTCLRGPTSGA